jgi:hypothetical protein
MSDDDFTPILILLSCTALIFLVLGFTTGTVTARQETEEKTVVYCIEKPANCKVKYEFYKLQEEK